MSPSRQPTSGRSLRSQQLAVIAKGYFDIPPWTRNLLTVAGICGAIVVTVASLVGNQPATIEFDKILHFSGYFVLAFVMVLGLRPVWYIPGLLALVALGFLIEELQPLNGRSKDIEDAIANTIGVAAGAFAGILLRFIYSLIRKELTTAAIRRRLQTYPAGAMILAEGSRSKKFFIIKSGQVRIVKQVDDQPRELTTLGPGEVFGIMGIIQGTGHYASVQAIRPTTLFGMNLSELMDSAGGVEHPVSLVLATFADKMRELVDRLNELESDSD